MLQLVHTGRCEIRWGDMDAFGHVNNTLFFRYMEDARVGWFETLRAQGKLDPANGTVLVQADCTFLLPMHYPGTVETRMFAGAPGRTSFMTRYELRLIGDERVRAFGTAKMVWTDIASGRPVPLPDVLRNLLSPV